ncbi:MAG: bifunctional folylpolyglutamate synthase/dihydrofolate synthase [Chloroflexi bacterium]|nr:bifunctional folylpolyglutamate synthase/dihydrofolate synthase [Chloroflexota bacterium]
METIDWFPCADIFIVSIAHRRPNVTLTFMTAKSTPEHARYMDAVNQLLSLADFERKSRANQPPDWHLRRVERLMEMLGDPHLATPVIHIAGSKGKGSTCAMIAAGLTATGFQTGLFTSPHLHSFTERIRVDGSNVSKSEFADLVDELWPMAAAIEKQGDLGVVSVFEMLTAMALVHFRRIGADFAVIETGLGGRLDSTNVVDPEVAVITSINLDHVRILGDTVSQIAREKAGIIKPGKPTVVAKNHAAVWGVFRERADEVGSELVSACATTAATVDEDRVSDDLRQKFVLKRWRAPEAMVSESALRIPPDPGLLDVKIRSPLLGMHQIDNARTAATTLNVLYRQGHQFDVNSAIRGIENVDWPCRTEVLEVEGWPQVILDGAHNNASLKALRDTISRIGGRYGEERINGAVGNEVAARLHSDLSAPYGLIMGATEGHEFEEMAKKLAEAASYTIATQSRHPKSSPAARLADTAREHGLESTTLHNVGEALDEARRLARENPEIRLIVVTGSLFVAAEAREHLLGIVPEIYEDLKQPYMVAYEADDETVRQIGSKIA